MQHPKMIQHLRHWLNTKTPPIRRAIVFAAVICLWMLTGLFGCSHTPAPETPALFKVMVKPSTAQTIERTLTLRGDIAADRTADIKAETVGRIGEMRLPKGSVVQQGDILFTLAPDSRPKKLAEAKANLAHFEKEFETSKGLEKKGFQAENRVAEALANLEAARTALADIQLDLQHTQIKAPFDGIFEHHYVDVGDSITLGADLAKVIDADPLVLKGFVPQNAVHKVQLTRPVQAQTLSGQGLEGKVRYLAAQADPITRTYALEVAVPNPNHLRLIGSSVTMHVSLGFVPAHFISSAFLSLSTDGALGIKTLEAENKVAFYPIEIVLAESNGVWVSGVPEKATLITVGHGFADVGQQVDPIYPEASAEPPSAAAVVE